MPPEVKAALSLALYYRQRASGMWRKTDREIKHRMSNKFQKHLNRADKYLTNRSN